MEPSTRLRPPTPTVAPTEPHPELIRAQAEVGATKMALRLLRAQERLSSGDVQDLRERIAVEREASATFAALAFYRAVAASPTMYKELRL